MAVLKVLNKLRFDMAKSGLNGIENPANLTNN